LDDDTDSDARARIPARRSRFFDGERVLAFDAAAATDAEAVVEDDAEVDGTLVASNFALPWTGKRF